MDKRKKEYQQILDNFIRDKKSYLNATLHLFICDFLWYNNSEV